MYYAINSCTIELHTTYLVTDMKRLKLDFKQDVDECENGYMVFLPYGWRWCDDIVHVRGFDTLKELRAAIKTDVETCDCRECVAAAEPIPAAITLKDSI